ncbi:MAG: uroporphyrinogen-III C-methyltransferase [Chloroflexi bacterium]|nr:uroporphyrinogen-III C-methyltransferase [Chloroflexota bacterium]
MSEEKGRVYLVGAGPGDPALITLAAVEALAKADVVVYDRLANPQLLMHAPAQAERVFAGKGPDQHTMSQQEINALLVDRGRAGKRVVRLKGGDPFVFGRGGEEAEALAEAGLPFEVVPGVSSAIAAAAYAGIPITHRGLGSSVAFVTGHEDPAKEEQDVDWSKIATAVDTLVLLMGVGRLAQVVERLIAAGRVAETPAAVIEWGTLPRQRTVTGTLGDIVTKVAEAGIRPPAITVVGEVVRLRETLRWFDTRPLFGKRVLVTRTREQASELARALAEAGAEPVELPTIEIKQRYDEAKLKAAAVALSEERYAWLIFTSANAVDIFFGFLRDRGSDARNVRASVAAIGPGTAAALERRGIAADLTPDSTAYTAEGLLAAFDERGGVQGCSVLLPRAEGARDALIEGLTNQGATVDEVTLYVAETPRDPDAEGLRRLCAGEIDVATFASSSAVRNLIAMLGDDLEPLRRCAIACIGPITAATVEELLGRPPDVVAPEHTVAGLVRALVEATDGARQTAAPGLK